MRAKLMLALVAAVAILLVGCGFSESDIRVTRVETKIATDATGKSTEQKLVEKRLLDTNTPGQVLFVYCGSVATGQLIFQSLAEGKVVSSGKRLSPKELVTYKSDDTIYGGQPVHIGAHLYYTTELLQDDGLYGDSVPYLFWFDVDGTYFQSYVTEETFLAVTTRPIDFSRLSIKAREQIITSRKSDKIVNSLLQGANR